MNFKCKLCGYVINESEYKNMAFRCPICGVDRYNFEEYLKEEIDKKVYISKDNLSINRTLETCINCGMCKRTCNKQVGLNLDDKEPFCVNCGNCILTCPTGALTPKYNYKEVLKNDGFLLNVNGTI